MQKCIANTFVLKSFYIKVFGSLLLLVFVTQELYCQHDIGKYEYRWALWHPITALKIKQKLPTAMLVYKAVKSQKRLDTLENGGKLDAFRHTYVMAYLSKFVKVEKLKKLGIAHEKDNKLQFYKNKLEDGERPDSLACEMDLRNNALGFEIGKNFRNSVNDELLNAVIEHIKDGKAWYLKRNSENSYVTCENEVINMKFYLGSWFVPKCLISTNL